MEATVCTPWHEVSGFFFGDDTYEFHDDLSGEDGPVLNVERVDYENGLLGNSIFGTTNPFTHTYEMPNNTIAMNGYSESQLWVAYFVGGNRMPVLNNNALGRYRLETSVKLEFVNGVLLDNNSPRAAMIPMLPVPYVESNEQRLGAHFQVIAYDPDNYKSEIRDEVRFFLGNSREHGGIMANPIYTRAKSDSAAFEFMETWFQDYYYRFMCQNRMGAPETAARFCRDSRYLGPFADPSYTSDTLRYDESELYDDWTALTHTPQPPPNLDIDPRSGLVTWETGSQPGAGPSGTSKFGTRVVGGQSAGGLVPGFYNVVVMIEERHNGDTSMGYPDHIDDRTGDDINFNDITYDVVPAGDGTGGRKLLQTEATVNQGYNETFCFDDYDGFDGTNRRRPLYEWSGPSRKGFLAAPEGYPYEGGVRTCRASPQTPPPPSINTTYGGVKIPVDFNLYLYPTMHYCSKVRPTAIANLPETDCFRV